MKLKPGYKKTEVGVIPEDWETSTFSQIFDISAGRDLVKEDFSVFKDSKFAFPIYSNAHSDAGLYGYSKSSQYGENKVTVTARGEVGHAEYRETPFCAIGRLLVLSLKTQGSSKFYSEFINNRITFALESTGVPQLTAPQISKYSIAIPTKAEQEAIAGALSDADELIASLEKIIEKKRMIKQGAMQELLTGKKRLPGFQQKPGYKQTEVGEIPEDWEVNSLDDLGDFKNGLNKDKDSFGHGSPFVNLMDVFGVSSINSSEQLGLVDSSSYEQSVYSLKKGDVLFIRSSVKPSGVGLTALIKKDLPNTVYSGFLIRFRSTAFKADKFKEHCFYEKNFRQRLINSSSVSANTNINQENLGKLCMALPPTEEEQEAIATVLSDMDTDIEALKKKLEKARKIKAGMMHNLLTGTIRLV